MPSFSHRARYTPWKMPAGAALAISGRLPSRFRGVAPVRPSGPSFRSSGCPGSRPSGCFSGFCRLFSSLVPRRFSFRSFFPGFGSQGFPSPGFRSSRVMLWNVILDTSVPRVLAIFWFYNKCWGLVDTPVHKTPCLTIK